MAPIEMAIVWWGNMPKNTFPLKIHFENIYHFRLLETRLFFCKETGSCPDYGLEVWNPHPIAKVFLFLQYPLYRPSQEYVKHLPMVMVFICNPWLFCE